MFLLRPIQLFNLGKGFAVVAAEVKGLADQTAKATDQIATQITGMQGISEKSVAAIGAIAQQIEADECARRICRGGCGRAAGCDR